MPMPMLRNESCRDVGRCPGGVCLLLSYTYPLNTIDYSYRWGVGRSFVTPIDHDLPDPIESPLQLPGAG